FFFQAEDGIRDLTVTGVQTCALPIYVWPILCQQLILLGRVTYQLLAQYWPNVATDENLSADHMNTKTKLVFSTTLSNAPWGKYRSEERRVGKECRTWWSTEP